MVEFVDLSRLPVFFVKIKAVKDYRVECPRFYRSSARVITSRSGDVAYARLCVLGAEFRRL